MDGLHMCDKKIKHSNTGKIELWQSRPQHQRRRQKQRM